MVLEVGDVPVWDGAAWTNDPPVAPGTYAEAAATATALATKADADATPTLEELAVGSVLFTGAMSTTQSFPFFVAPFGLSVVQASLSNWDSAVAASNTDYWTIDLRRTRANVTVVIASKTSRVTGGEAIPQRGDWNFDAVAFDPANKVLLKGDILNLAFTTTGSPTALNKLAASARYIPT